MRRFGRFGVGGLLLSGLVVAGGPAFADNGAALAERLHRAEAASSLDADGLKAWHLMMSVQLYDAKGQPTGDQGTIEEWWAGPKARRVVYTTPDFTMTEVQNAKGLFRSKDAGSVPVQLGLLLDQVVHPMPPASEIDESTPALEEKKFGKVPLDCVMLSGMTSHVVKIPLGLFPTYCFDAGKDALRASFDFGSQLIVRNAVGRFQSREVATEVTVEENGVRTASSKLTTLQMTAADAVKTDDVGELVSSEATIQRISGSAMAGRLIKKVSPKYPAGARGRQATGAVIIRAIIGRDGHIHSMQLKSFPDAELAIASLEAVRQWTYRPYMLNGLPAEVDTTITVNFNISHGSPD